MSQSEPIVFNIDRQQWRPRKSGPLLRLIKTVWQEALPAGTRLKLLGTGGRVLDEEVIHPEHAFPLGIGFWIPAAAVGRPVRLRIIRPGGSTTRHSVRLGKQSAPALPLSPIDDLHGYLQQRERAANRWPGVATLDVPRYLRRHAIVYERPADHWTEGLYLGNGIVGGVITGDRSGILRFGLDHARVWFADEKDRPIGRGYASDLTLSYTPAGDSFRQVLDIGRGEVDTQHGSLRITSWIDRDTSLVFVELVNSQAQKVDVHLGRRELAILSEGLPAVGNDSWIRALPQEVLDKSRRQLADAPRALNHVEPHRFGGSLICRAPNVSVVTTLHAASATRIDREDNSLSFTLELKPNQPQRIVLAVATCEKGAEATTVRDHRKQLSSAAANKDAAERHHRAWRRFWNRSFLQLSDPLQESVYYHGIYHVGCTFAGNHAASFFGMTQPIDHRTWRDGNTTDAQTQMLQWGTLASNHLASAAPLLRTYAEAWIEHAEHTTCPGAKVPHMFYPRDGGGHASLAPPPKLPYPFGSTAWHALDFWWDYLYSQDRRFLKDIAYPILRSASEAIVGTLTLRDGRYHCLDSNCPEQNDAHDDNVYDRTCVHSLLEATIHSSRVLNVDRAERARFMNVLKRLYPLATDGKTLFDCPANHHPYRCHPVVLMGLYPLALWPPGSREHRLANRTFDVVTNVYGFHYEDRHKTIVGHEGGVEPNGHATAFLLGAAARLRRPSDFDRLFDAVVVGRQLKRNGLRAISDPRHSIELERMGIIEASSGQSAAISELVLQSWQGHIDVFPCARRGRPERFAGLRAFGGFVVSGEWTADRVRFVAVHSLSGGNLDLRAPWKPGSTIWVKRLNGAGAARPKPARFPTRLHPGQTVVFGCDRQDLDVHHWQVPDEPPAKPLAIPISQTDEHLPEVLYYPEDPPFGQECEAGHLFLGNPAVLPTPDHPTWDEAVAQRYVKSPDFRVRQTAARVLGRHPTANARKCLQQLALDPVTLVAATAIVSLVRHRTAPSDRAVKHLIPKLPPYVQREAEKALRRRGS